MTFISHHLFVSFFLVFSFPPARPVKDRSYPKNHFMSCHFILFHEKFRFYPGLSSGQVKSSQVKSGHVNQCPIFILFIFFNNVIIYIDFDRDLLSFFYFYFLFIKKKKGPHTPLLNFFFFFIPTTIQYLYYLLYHYEFI